MMKTVIKNDKKQPAFQVFFLKNNDNQEIKAVEVNEIDFKKIKEHLAIGDSVYITSNQPKKPEVTFIAYEQLNKPWYFVRS
ncbi:MAG: hypothetical protein IAX21_01150 [Candidatus Bathyarchaeota archaeon]|nr:hypothetical protein [Candidatus Bathyarchaeum tardum]WGM90425.1 MAG: hypothetical protein NUK63_04695 [Candidatus Bathyarchaeum tardum]WNZ29506.1 MAG: hypothetical protein IAX21_01150 [Candidatus Bathyarchaeota archaeon]